MFQRIQKAFAGGHRRQILLDVAVDVGHVRAQVLGDVYQGLCLGSPQPSLFRSSDSRSRLRGTGSCLASDHRQSIACTGLEGKSLYCSKRMQPARCTAAGRLRATETVKADATLQTNGSFGSVLAVYADRSSPDTGSRHPRRIASQRKVKHSPAPTTATGADGNAKASPTTTTTAPANAATA